MAWSFRKLLGCAAIPAAVFFIGWMIRYLASGGRDESIFEVAWPIGIIILLLWLASATFWWLIARIVQRLAAKRDGQSSN